MRMRFALLSTTVAVVLCVATLRASSAYFDGDGCYYDGEYHTGYRVQSVASYDSGVGLGTVDLWDTGCYAYVNNTMTVQTYVEARNSVTWELLSADHNSYYWEGDTPACQVTLLVTVSGERYEGGFFSINYTLNPVSCD
jgi:hypothetical protein